MSNEEHWVAERDRAIECWRTLVGGGILGLEEFEIRLNAAYSVESQAELEELFTRFPVPAAETSGRHSGTRSPLLLAGGIVAVLLLIVLLISRSGGQAPKSSAGAPLSVAPTSAPLVAGPTKPLGIAVVAPGLFAKHDPADQCGAGNSNCYLVVRFTNKGPVPVTFVPADLKLVDLRGNATYPGAVLPRCYDIIDINAPLTLVPHAHVTVQLGYPMLTGGYPAELLGTLSLNGLSSPVPANAVSSKWGGN